MYKSYKTLVKLYRYAHYHLPIMEIHVEYNIHNNITHFFRL